MRYLYSNLDRRNLKWFPNDKTKATLLHLGFKVGDLRGVQDIDLRFEYPISVIAGRNGSGKSTILAAVACAYHNRSKIFNPLGKKVPYYTFSDFFIQSSDEVPPQGVQILYGFLYDGWKRTPKYPKGIGLGWQWRHKRKKGRWNKYQDRISRNVVFLGIDRVVPRSERSVSRSYRRSFKPVAPEGWETEVRETVGRILNRDYEEFGFHAHAKYKLPYVTSGGLKYSGFNMGAGENALFNIFSIIYSCDESLLLVIDEIELGLHDEAQERLIDELKKLCGNRRIQIICTTHSPTILKSLPPEGRFFIPRIEDVTEVIRGISPEFAAGKLSRNSVSELDIFVEDNVAKCITEKAIDVETRQRSTILPIGSDVAVIQQMIARYRESTNANVCAILDGDTRTKKNQFVNMFQSQIDGSDEISKEWIQNRVSFVPGNEWPEKWILTSIKEDNSELARRLGINVDTLGPMLADAIREGKHREFDLLSQRLNLDEDQLLPYFVDSALEYGDGDTINDFISNFLE